MVALNFNASNVKPNAALEAIPSGMYPVLITKSEEKPTKSGNGSYIEFEMTVQPSPHVDPQYHNRKVYDRLNINNPNQQAVDIAYATLSAICHVTGVLNMTDTQQLHGRPFVAVVSKRVRDDLPPPAPGEQPQYSNEVKGYKDMNGNDPGFAGQVQSAQAQPQWANQQQVQQQPQVEQQVQQPVQQQPANGGTPAWAGNGQQQPAPAQQEQPQQQVQQQAPAPAGAVPSWAQKR